MNKVCMAIDTIIVHNFNIKLLNRNNLIIGVQCECCTVVKTINRFRKVLVDNIVVRAMTIIATGNTCMGRVTPGIKLVLHDMAVDTGTGIVRKIGMPFGLRKCKNRHADNEKQHP